jgi:tetratricopeptide (TPR) repeat protein
MSRGMSLREQAAAHFKRGDELAWIESSETAALKEYRSALELFPAYPEAHWRIGQIHFFAASPRLEDALQAFQDVIRIAPDWSEGHFWVANTLREMGRLEEAIKEYEEAIRLGPTDPRHHISYGNSLSQMGRHEEAVAALRRGVQLKPHYGEASARMFLADALKATGQLQAAMQEWRFVASMKVVSYFEEGEPERARALLRQYSA